MILKDSPRFVQSISLIFYYVAIIYFSVNEQVKQSLEHSRYRHQRTQKCI